MGSLELEEEELLQMVHDFIESESSSSSPSSLDASSSSSSYKNVGFGHSTTYFTLQEILRKKTEEERRIHDRVMKHMRNKMDMEKNNGLKEWLVKCLILDGFNASLCHTSWVTTPGCPCGNYEYIEIMEKNAMENPQRIIVDIDFESQFEVARPTQSYKELSSKLPNIFVGSEQKLRRIVSMVCSAAEKSLRERGLHIPPWRRPNYMKSKWELSKGASISNHKSDMCPKNRGTVASRFGEGVPPNVMIKGIRSRDKSGGSSGLSNQFSNTSINCC